MHSAGVVSSLGLWVGWAGRQGRLTVSVEDVEGVDHVCGCLWLARGVDGKVLLDRRD